MSVTSTYRQEIYTEINFTGTRLESISQTLPKMYLTLIGSARILTGELKKSQSNLLAEYNNWQYFLAEFSQYIENAKQVRFEALSQMLTTFLLDIHIKFIH